MDLRLTTLVALLLVTPFAAQADDLTNDVNYAAFDEAAVAVTPGEISLMGHEACDEASSGGLWCGSGPSGCRGDGGCRCAECRDKSSFERFCDRLKIKKRKVLRDHYRSSFDHYRHLHHPECPPYCSPSWGYHQTCWRRFPEHTLWCPECPAPYESMPLDAVPLPSPSSAPMTAPPIPAPIPEPAS